MKRVSATFVPPIALQHRVQVPMYRQLYDWFRQAIAAGQVRPGQRLPSTRTLAAELKISRMPVSNAYEQLQAEGYLETFRGAGTRVARTIPEDPLNLALGPQKPAGKKGPRRLSRRGAALTRFPAQSWLNTVGAFRVSLPALDHFPL